MEDQIFRICYELYVRNPGNQPIWNQLAALYQYPSGESIRSSFKRELVKRGFKNKTATSSNARIELPRIVVADIEMLPAIAYAFGRFDQNISQSQIIEEGTFLSWAAKELNSDFAVADILTSDEAIERDPERIVLSVWKYLSDAEIVIGHNWKNFDGKILNTMFLKYGLMPLNYLTIDTLEIARANFRFPSNKLANINIYLGIRNKIENEGFPLWDRCSKGDAEALAEMADYNVGDTYATEELYYKLRPFVKKHPNLALFNTMETEQCPNCGSDNLKVEGLYPPVGSGRYESIRCLNCGALSRGKHNLLTKNKRSKILSK